MSAYMLRTFVVTLLGIAITVAPAIAEKKYDPGATDTEIKIGNVAPYTGLFGKR